MKLDATDLQTNETDDRGRIYHRVREQARHGCHPRGRVRIPDDDELAAAYPDASDSASSLADG